MTTSCCIFHLYQIGKYCKLLKVSYQHPIIKPREDSLSQRFFGLYIAVHLALIHNFYFFKAVIYPKKWLKSAVTLINYFIISRNSLWEKVDNPLIILHAGPKMTYWPFFKT